MIHYEHFVLDNGLRVYLHPDTSTSYAVVNLLYRVGSKDEDENRTGLAHLFEHLMFGGSLNIPKYDEALQRVGGTNNAFTSPDITNYYISLPVDNIETAFWLESDRMLSLSFEEKTLEVQRKVVIEEFKQRYLNQPYGDIWLKLRPEVYKKHPYRWATIGKDISHIEQVTMEEVKDFFFRFYRPNNAALVVAGNLTLEKVKALAQKWFGDIPPSEINRRDIPQELPQSQARKFKVEADVPLDAFYRVYHTPDRLDANFHNFDLLSDILGRGKSSILYQELVRGQKLFNNVGAFLMGSFHPGMFIIQGKLNQGKSFERVEESLDNILQDFFAKGISENALEKVKNRAESSLAFSEVDLLNRAINLATYDALGNVDLVNQQGENIQAVTKEAVEEQAQTILKPENSTTMWYGKSK